VVHNLGRRFEQVLLTILSAMVALIVALATLDLLWMIIQDLISPPIILLDITELLDLFGFVLIILVGIELLETIKGYLREHVVRLEVVLDLALIAIARKIIVLEMTESAPLAAFGIAVVVLALGIARYLVRSRSDPATSASGSQGDSRPTRDDQEHTSP
jgi:uncharacterized membrane protein (DUF373 family)